MRAARWHSTLTDAKLQWQGNLRLRMGVWVVLAICWVYGLLLAGDGVEALRKSAASTQDEIDRQRPLSKTQAWPARLADAQSALTTLRALQWGDGSSGAGGRADPALVEAAFQDWARGTAAKAGLRIRDLSLARATTAPTSIGGAPAGSAAMDAPPAVLRLRITAELGRTELMLFLAEAARHERVVLVERLLVRPAVPVGVVEIDLRAVLRGEVTAATADNAVRSVVPPNAGARL